MQSRDAAMPAPFNTIQVFCMLHFLIECLSYLVVDAGRVLKRVGKDQLYKKHFRPITIFLHRLLKCYVYSEYCVKSLSLAIATR